MNRIFRKISGLLQTIFFALLPCFLNAEKMETKIIADYITVNSGEVISAKGNVRVQYGENTIRAQALTFNQESNKIHFTKIKDFYDGQAIKFSAEEASISRNFSRGVISKANLLIDDTIKIKSEKVQLKDGQIFSASGISRVTSCEECEGKDPNWYLSSSSAKRDFENSNIIYKDVIVRVKGLPIAYIPYLRMPDPSVERARGFLIPEAVLTSNLATGLKLPYFIPIGSSSDILITPYFSSKTKTIEYRYRQKFRSGNLTVKGAFSDDNLADSNFRYFSQLAGNFKLGYGFDLNFNAGKVSDTSYLGDYVYNEESDFNSEISLGKTIVGKQQFFDGDLSYLRKKEPANSLNEYYSLSGSYVKGVSPVNFPGRLELSAYLNSSVNVNDNNSVSRPPSSAQIGINYRRRDLLAPFLLSTELFSHINSFVNSADTGTTNEEILFQYGALASISSPYIMKGKGKSNILIPKASVSFNGQDNDILGDYFIGADELSWGNIYSGKKVMSLSESETGNSISIGLENHIRWKTGEHLEIAFAASKIDSLTYLPTVSQGLTSGKVNYLGKFFYKTRNDNILSANTLFSSKGQLLKSDIKGNYFFKKINLKGNYEFIDHAADNRISEDLSVVNFSSSYNFSDYWRASAGGRYDLSEDQMAETSFQFGFSLSSWEYNLKQDNLKGEREKLALSAIYDDKCTRLIFSFENRYQQLGSSEPIRILGFRVQLKPFANVAITQRLTDLQLSNSVF